MSRLINVLVPAAPTLQGQPQRTRCIQAQVSQTDGLRISSVDLTAWAHDYINQDCRILISTPNNGLQGCQWSDDGLFAAHDLLESSLSSGFLRLEVCGRLRGGKGGFGTLLRGKGARGPKTSNFDSSRYLDGRRVRVAQAPEKLRQWVFKKVQERAVIKAVGGEDKYMGKSLSSADVIKKYKLQLTTDNFHGTNDKDHSDEEAKKELRATVVSSAIEILNRQNHDLDLNQRDRNKVETAANKTKFATTALMDSYLDVSEEF